MAAIVIVAVVSSLSDDAVVVTANDLPTRENGA